jgi:hypothetical protein
MQRLLIGNTQPQRRRHHDSQCVLDSFSGRVVVVGVIEV